MARRFDPLRPGDRAAADRRRVFGDGCGHALGKSNIFLVKTQKSEYRLQKVFQVLALSFFTAASIGLLSFGKTLGGPLGFQFGTAPFDVRTVFGVGPGKKVVVIRDSHRSLPAQCQPYDHIIRRRIIDLMFLASFRSSNRSSELRTLAESE